MKSEGRKVMEGFTNYDKGVGLHNGKVLSKEETLFMFLKDNSGGSSFPSLGGSDACHD